jgi:hypothetical protein
MSPKALHHKKDELVMKSSKETKTWPDSMDK